MPDPSPKLSYWHVWTDESGTSRQSRAELTDFAKESMGGDADPQYNRHLPDGPMHIIFTTQPAGWVGEWHENPQPQWIIPIQGKWFVETMDGARVEMGPGELSFGADQGTTGGKGHRSGVVGDQDCQLMVIQLLEDKYRGARPGYFD
jgi:hypothetical protein